LLGAHQAGNLALALAAAERLLARDGRGLDEGIVRDALQDFTLPGRLEVVGRDPTTIVDGAHTPASLAAAIEAARAAFAPDRIVLVLAMASDKDLTAAAHAVSGADRVIATRYDHPRAARPEELPARVRAAGGAAEVEPDLQKAC